MNDAKVTDIAAVYSEVTKVHRDLRADDSFARDLRIDSIEAIEMMSLLELRFGVQLIDNPKVVGAETVGQLVELINELTVAPS